MSRAYGGDAGAVASADQLKAAMRRWATGVAVVTMRSESELRGVTVNSFAFVLLDPPLILVCLNRWVRTHHALLATRRFCVNLLSEDQRALSDRFTERRLVDDFSGINHQFSAGVAPILDAGLTWLDCKLVDTHAAGDYTIFIGLVLQAHIGGEGTPLLHQAGNYHTLADGDRTAGK